MCAVQDKTVCKRPCWHCRLVDGVRLQRRRVAALPLVAPSARRLPTAEHVFAGGGLGRAGHYTLTRLSGLARTCHHRAELLAVVGSRPTGSGRTHNVLLALDLIDVLADIYSALMLMNFE